MTAYRWVYDSHHLQADCQEPELAPEPYARLSSFFTSPDPTRQNMLLSRSVDVNQLTSDSTALC